MDEDRTDEKIQLNIFGSCVSRDVLEVQEKKSVFLNTYIARESIVSAVSKPVMLEADRLNLDSGFQKKMVMHDFQKDAFELFEMNQADFILIDFIDERFPLVKIGHSYATYSNELMSSGYISNPKLVKLRKTVSPVNWLCRTKKDKWRIDKIDMDKYIIAFCQRLLSIYRPGQIILHEVYLSDSYINSENQVCTFPENHLKNNRQLNEKYEYVYRKFEECIPNAYVIDISKQYMADENHKWGLSPMHFQKEYYKKVLEILMKTMEGH